MVKPPLRLKPDLEWSDLVAGHAAEELIAGRLIAPERADFAQRIIAQQIHIFLISGLRPTDENSN
ncbi:hypothetical protein [Bradyrhizobium sp. Tv2a-2]|uniref:hypothetical protein n=1 Tax=Bradyrhizobium sp. Tv2a-2 TaxID=113395 RepID=UPI0012EC8541|nr:hypothetical protein [Bradyrhizobium sp. Tv2a-2]